MHPSVRLVLLDVEGTTLPVSFVHRVMFPYAEKALPALLRDGTDPQVKEAVAAIALTHPGEDPLQVCLGWMAKDEKTAPLKTLQGIVWRRGFEDGTIRPEFYPDVIPALKAWKAAGLRLAVYSSGSVPAQKLLYGHTAQGDLTGLFAFFFDLSTGGKKEAASYGRIVRTAGLKPGEILFLSDSGAELDAAAAVDLRVCQVVRAEDGTAPHEGVPHAADLAEVSRLFDLPG